MRPRLAVIPAFSLIGLASVLAACGDADPGRITGAPGAHATGPGTAGNADASTDSAPNYRDPATSDAGCVAPNLVCDSVCIAVGSDHDHCGACNKACVGADSVCVAGSCACTGPMVAYCDGTGCVDVSSDTNNCGACGHVCDPSQYDACENVVCVSTQ